MHSVATGTAVGGDVHTVAIGTVATVATVSTASTVIVAAITTTVDTVTTATITTSRAANCRAVSGTVPAALSG